MRTALVALGILLSLAAAGRAASLPSISDAQADFNTGNYRGCLQKISSLLTSNQVKPGSIERYDLLMLRGESMLHLRMAAAAAEAFDSAALVLKQQGDIPRVAAAKAVSVLIKASPGLVYKPKDSNGNTSFDIINPDTRKEAMKLLLANRSAELTPAINQALQGASLVPLQKLLPAVWDLYALEFAATGSATQTDATVKKMGEHARKLIDQELTAQTRRLTELRNLANEPTLTSNGRQDSISYRGLTTHERDEIKSIANDLVKIQRVLEQGRRINHLLGGTGEAWDALLANCAEARDIAQEAYDRRY